MKIIFILTLFLFNFSVWAQDQKFSAILIPINSLDMNSPLEEAKKLPCANLSVSETVQGLVINSMKDKKGNFIDIKTLKTPVVVNGENYYVSEIVPHQDLKPIPNPFENLSSDKKVPHGLDLFGESTSDNYLILKESGKIKYKKENFEATFNPIKKKFEFSIKLH